MRDAVKDMATTEPHPRKGWVEAGARILAQLLRTTRFKDNLRLILNNLDPDYAPELVRVALNTDPAVPLAVLGALPRGANIAVEATAQLATEVARKPRTLVREAGRELWQRVNVERAGEAAGVLLSMLIGSQDRAPGHDTDPAAESRPVPSVSSVGSVFNPTDNRFWKGMAAATQQQLGRSPLEVLAPLLLDGLAKLATEAEQVLVEDGPRAEALRELARGVERVLARNPELRRQVVAPLLESLREE